MNWTTMAVIAALAGMFAALLMWIQEDKRQAMRAGGASAAESRVVVSNIP